MRPASPWNYGLLIDPEDPEAGLEFEERPVGERPFSPEGAGVVAQARGRRLTNWGTAHGWAAEVRPGLHASEAPLEQIELKPYGCTNIRVTELPRLEG